MTDTARTQATAPGRPRPPGQVVRTAVSGLGQLLITAGVVILLFLGYELWFTGLYTHREQRSAEKAIQQRFSAAQARPAQGSDEPATTQPPGRGKTGRNGDVVYPPVTAGAAQTVVYLPRLGSGYHYVVVEGVGTDDLRKGPGHYPGTALPGQRGNVVVSGHRTTYLAPFSRLDELRPGDPVIFEMVDGWYTYRVVGTRIVAPDATYVITNPYPDQRPIGRSFTFTTCNPRYSARQRLVVYGTFVSHTAFNRPPAGVDPVTGG